MKAFLVLAACLSVALAATEVWHDPSHYEQHRQSVEAARRKANIESFGSSSSGTVGGTVSGTNSIVCGLCAEGQFAQSASDAEHIDASNVNGIGVVYPTVAGGSSSSASEFESEFEQSSGGVSGVAIPVASGSNTQYSASSLNSVNENVASAPIVIPVSGGGSEHYSSSSQSEHIASGGVALPTVAVFPAGGSSAFSQRYHDEQISNAGIPSVPLAVPAFPSSSAHLMHASQRINSAPVYAPVYPVSTGGSSSRLSSHRESHSSASNVLPTQTIVYSSPSVSQRISESSSRNVVSGGSTPAFVSVAPVGGGSSFSHHSSNYLNSGSTGGIVAPIVTYPIGGGHSSASKYLHESSSSNAGGLGGVAVYPSVGVSGSQLGSRFGHSSAFDSGFSSGVSSGLTSSGLSGFMSESERLARLQAQNVHSSSSQSGSVYADQYNSGSGLTGAYVQPTTGSFGKTKSWEKSSKWASQSEYDSTGRQKSTGFVTTAEGEDQTLNGQTTGYKAATTTVEDDGKRSTYSIHS